MKRALVMTVIGADRPGIVEEVSGVVSEQGGNWIDCRMVNLAGDFAGVVHVEIEEENRNSLLDRLATLAESGLRVVVQGSGEVPAERARSDDRSVIFHLVGQDRPGIIASVSRALARHGGNVEELQSGCKSAPMTGESLFEATVRFSLPASVSLDSVRVALESIAADLLVDISLEEN